MNRAVPTFETKMTQKAAEDPAALVRLIEKEEDFAVLIWAAGALSACLLKQAPLSSYSAAFDEFLQPEGMKYLPELWLNNDILYQAPPPDAALVIASRIERLHSLEGSGYNHNAMEATAWLLNALLDLIRDIQRRDGEKIRRLLLSQSQMVAVEDDASLNISMTGFRGALIGTMTAKAHDTDDITTNRDVAFIAGTHLLAHLCEGDQEVALLLQRCKVPELVCERIFHKVSLSPAELYKRKLPLRFEAFAAASCTFLQLFLEAEPALILPHQYRKMIDAMVAVLDKSFHGKKSAVLPYGAMTVHLEHDGAFRVLKHVVDACPGEIPRLVEKRGIFYATEMLKLEACHQDALLLVCDVLERLLKATSDPEGEARSVGLPRALERMIMRYKKYPLATTRLHAQVATLRALIGVRPSTAAV